MLPYMFAFAAVVSGAKVQRRQDSCSSTITLSTLSVTTVEPISIYILPGQLAPTGTSNNEEAVTIVYQTVYATFCPNCPGGLQAQTYTVTQTCTGNIASCRPLGNVLPAGFTTTQATCTDCPTPFSAILTVPTPEPTDVVVTETVLQTITEPSLTTTRAVVRTYTTAPALPTTAPSLSSISYNGRVQTFDVGNFAEAITATATVIVTQEKTATATVTVDANGDFKPVGLNSGAGRLVSSDRILVFGMSAFVLLLLASS
ncbi:hypothetical protein CGRA01v4_04316 [Colletotrichum graminicola]|uniref:Uncharacterized protein n=1 Tax=Colletotrichum graminicola (strain M1.001 / M2 / FGSC 10212) TaxID=645133 RepID=E3Q980_COLGM|nr:uncharacterized protein GLRG_01754 [Colletotrichum graminicola M1.001]EFQ27259.1 hypothetical protein GLRG_01754 [Colletotrichum graminicola M1.001]WDK13035.1 hypothetical protein CGRA01v4_04316 [Colletotrichum graminicola]